MAISDFGVTADAVKRHHFPNFNAFSTASNPTSTTVDEAIQDAAAELGGKLRLANIDPADIDADSTTEAFHWCAVTVRLDVALRIYRAVTSQEPPKAWEADLEARLKALADGGATVLGAGATEMSSPDPEGPFTHINEHSLDVADPTTMSDATPPLKKGDEL